MNTVGVDNNNGCGNCQFFRYEDTYGFGQCKITKNETYCGDCCEFWHEEKKDNYTKEERKEYGAIYYEHNKEKLKAQRREFYRKNKR